MVMIYIIRHGETEMNFSNRVNDKNIDTTLTKKGMSQAKKTGIYLKKIRHINSTNSVIFTSPLLRTIQTTTIIKDQINKKLQIFKDDRLVEVDKGDLSGLLYDDKKIQTFRKKIDDVLRKGDTLYKNEQLIKISDELDAKYHMEPASNIRSRLLQFFGDIPMNIENIIIITHYGIIESILRYIMNIVPTLSGDLTKGSNCCIMAIKKDIFHKCPIYTLLSLPNTEHL